jgi:outer membrane protein assembly factor BamD (BamD/ComL family)
LADEYLYWCGEAYFQNTNYAAAADVFGKLAGSFPASSRRLEASVREAAAWAKRGEWLRVAELLQNPNGPFRQAARGNPDNEFFARGLLLLAEAELTQKHHTEAEAALQPLASSKLTPELDWQRKYLICRAQLGAGRIDEAKVGSADLLSLAEKIGQRDWLAASVAFRAGILEQLGQRGEATALYQRNLTTNAPVEQQRQAILKIGGLALAQHQLAETIQKLETFLGRFSNSPAADVALLTLGELHLKQHVSLAETNHAPIATPPTAAATNHWQQALTNFDRLIIVFSNSVFVGKAQLGRGWCYWISSNIPESVAAFKAAAAQLPASEDLAVARFKLADGLFAQKDFAGALQNYRGALEAAADLPGIKEALTPQALYQMLRASLGLKDLAGAEDAMRKILESHPHSVVADRSVLLVGQGYADAEKPDQARARFREFVELFPGSVLRPEVELAMAQTREQESDWPAAIVEYGAWLDRFATNRLHPQAEFYRALANFHAGNETNALTQLTNFVAQFGTNDLAPLAQWWVADYYYRQKDYLSAETSFKRLFQTWPMSELANEASMMAGYAAVGRLEYAEAIGYFTNLTSNPNWPPLKIQATFAYGGALMLRDSGKTNNSASLREAIQVFGTIVSGTNAEQTARAWGEIGKCYFQLGAQEPQNYESASNAFQQVISSPDAGVAARSHAKVGLALVAEKQAGLKSGAEKSELLKLARDNYLDVFYETNLREGETRDLFWVKEAGLGAARVVEFQPFQEWSQAEKFYDRLLHLLPQMKDTLEKKKARAQAHLERKDN